MDTLYLLITRGGGLYLTVVDLLAPLPINNNNTCTLRVLFDFSRDTLQPEHKLQGGRVDPKLRRPFFILSVVNWT